MKFTQVDGPDIKATGQAHFKAPHPVYLRRIDGPFDVETPEGTLSCPDGYVAYDPLSGHVWPVTASYVEMHYIPTTIDEGAAYEVVRTVMPDAGRGGLS